MRILHTSDWHLGKTLEGHSRAAEHAAFLDEVVEIGSECDLILISGDIFDVYNPPIAAEEMFYDAMARLGDGGRRAVVAIAGNHDSPDRLAAPLPLAATHGVFILGRPGDQVRAGGQRGPGRIVLADAGPSVLELALPCGQTAVVAALPYPSESRLDTVLGSAFTKVERQRAYSDTVGAVFAELAGHFRGDTVNVVTSHLYVRGGVGSESERELLGDGYRVAAEALPGSAQYVALGHLHRPQNVEGAPTLARYCGAPLAFRMSERDHFRTHTVVEVEPGQPAEVHEIPISAGRPLVRWQVEGGLQQVLREIEDGVHADAFIDLAVHVPEPLNHAQIAAIRRLPRDFLRIRTVLPEAGDQVAPPHPADRRELPVSELFRAFYRESKDGQEPDDALVDLFVELTSAALGEHAA